MVRRTARRSGISAWLLTGIVIIPAMSTMHSSAEEEGRHAVNRRVRRRTEYSKPNDAEYVPPDRPLQLEDLDRLLQSADVLIDTKQSQDERREAGDRLGILGHQYGMPALLAVIRNEAETENLRASCVSDLSRIADQRAIDYLIETLTDDNRAVAYTALGSLQKVLRVGIGQDKELPRDDAGRQRLQDRWRQWWDRNRRSVEIYRTGAFMSGVGNIYTEDR
jgi:hypothetical protein